jgi:prepilin-type N-terminal cleavage/methylation domain-containing protein
MRRKKAFTLIELLVVIAIVALLMTILLLTLQRVRKQARPVVWQSNLRQWGLASSAYGSQDDGDARALLLQVIEAIKAIEHPETGKGSAVLKIHDYEGDHEKIVDFVFKDKLSRSDWYPSIEGKRAEREVSWAVGRKCSVGCNDYNAAVHVHPQRQFHRRFGYDFHPETFLRFLDTPLAEYLEALIKGPATISTGFSNNGILHINVSYEDEEIHEYNTISLDTAKGYRLVAWKDIMEYPNEPERNGTTICEIQWDEYGSTWYVKSAEFESDARISIPEAEPPVIKKPYKQRIRFVVTEFHPNVEIGDSEFTLEGLGLPGGMIVLDRIAGINYRCGSDLTTTEELKDALLGAEFSKSIQSELDMEDIKENTGTTDEQVESGEEASISNGESTPESLADTPGQYTYRNVFIIVALFMGVTIVAVLGQSLC